MKKIIILILVGLFTFSSCANSDKKVENQTEELIITSENEEPKDEETEQSNNENSNDENELNDDFLHLVEKMKEVDKKENVDYGALEEWEMNDFDGTEYTLIGVEYSGEIEIFFYDRYLDEMKYFNISSASAPYLEKTEFANGDEEGRHLFISDVSLDNSYIQENKLYMPRSGYHFWEPSEFPSILVYNIETDHFYVDEINLNQDLSSYNEYNTLQVGGRSLLKTALSIDSQSDNKIKLMFEVLEEQINDDVMPVILYEYDTYMKQSTIIMINTLVEDVENLKNAFNNLENIENTSVELFNISDLNQNSLGYINSSDYYKDSINEYYQYLSTEKSDLNCVKITFNIDEDTVFTGSIIKEYSEEEDDYKYGIILASTKE